MAVAVEHLFISYARDNRAEAQELAHLLEAKGFEVWWDTSLVGGSNFRDVIQRKIVDARKVLVLWSRQSVVSGFVIDEANEARKLGKLIPISIDDAQPPLGFGDVHTLSTTSLREDVQAILAAIDDKPSLPNRRPQVDAKAGHLLESTLAAATIIGILGGVLFAIAIHGFPAVWPIRIALCGYSCWDSIGIRGPHRTSVKTKI